MALTDFLTINRNMALKSFNIALNLKGLNCILVYPIENDSPIGLDDSIVNYNETAPEEKKMLIFNLFQENFQGGNEFDPFIDDVFILTKYEDKLPLQTKVRILLGTRTIEMKVDDVRNLSPHVTEQLFVKNILVALT